MEHTLKQPRPKQETSGTPLASKDFQMKSSYSNFNCFQEVKVTEFRVMNFLLSLNGLDPETLDLLKCLQTKRKKEKLTGDFKNIAIIQMLLCVQTDTSFLSLCQIAAGTSL